VSQLFSAVLYIAFFDTDRIGSDETACAHHYAASSQQTWRMMSHVRRWTLTTTRWW